MGKSKMIATPSKTREIIEKNSFHFKKSLGQNFIVDTNILENMITSVGIDDTAGVIEIGPGIGALTEQLAIHADRVLAFEIDERLLPILDETLEEYTNVTILHEDILKANVVEHMKEFFSPNQDVYVVANLPYYITTPIVMKLLEENVPFHSITIMIQKEVAERIAADPNSKQYGSLSIAVQYYTEPKISMIVPPSVFLPRPKVDSAVLELTKRVTPLVHVEDESYFFSLVRGCFAQRRKTVHNNLANYFKKKYSKDEIRSVLEDVTIDPIQRAESISIEKFADLANAFYAKEQSNS